MNIRIEIKDDTGKTHYVNDCKSIESLEGAIGQFERHFLKGVELADFKANPDVEVLYDTCPQCERKAFHLVKFETGDYHPDHESVYEDEIMVCEKCGHTEAVEYDEADMSYATE